MSLQEEIKKALTTAIKNAKTRFKSESTNDNSVMLTQFGLREKQYNARELFRIVDQDINHYGNHIAFWITQKAEANNYDLHQGVVIDFKCVLIEKKIINDKEELVEKKLAHASACFRALHRRDSLDLARISPEPHPNDKETPSPVKSEQKKEETSSLVKSAGTHPTRFFDKLNPFKDRHAKAAADPVPQAAELSTKDQLKLKRQTPFYGTLPTELPRSKDQDHGVANPDEKLIHVTFNS